MKAFFKKALTAAAIISASAVLPTVHAAEPVDLDSLLKQLEKGQIQQSEENRQREQEFMSRKSEQEALLNAAFRTRDGEIARSDRLETNFEENEVKLANLGDTLNKRLGSLKELFGVLQQVAGDTKSKFATSVVSAQIPGREAFLEQLAIDMGSSSKLASIEDIEKVWFELQREMTEQGKVARFNRDVIVAGGDKVNKEVVRVGAFNLVSDGKYLDYSTTTGSVAELLRQPSDRLLATATAVQQTTSGMATFGIDPTGGSILGLLVQAPNLRERVDQGGTVGYIILAVGAVGLLIALYRAIALTIVGGKVNRQLKSNTPSNDNPLGRILMVKDKYPQVDTETLELKLSEAILREVPKLGSGLTFIKIISVVAPLMGLLGTVTGMINTFQMITLFGTGDPKLMAGGISTALVTTVLGLVVAIPTTLIYAMLNTRYKNVVYVLQEQASGIVAERSESQAA